MEKDKKESALKHDASTTMLHCGYGVPLVIFCLPNKPFAIVFYQIITYCLVLGYLFRPVCFFFVGKT